LGVVLSDLEVDCLYALNYVDDTEIIICRYIGHEKGFYLFKDEEGEIFPVRKSSATARRVYSTTEAVGRNYGDTYHFEDGKLSKASTTTMPKNN